MVLFTALDASKSGEVCVPSTTYACIAPWVQGVKLPQPSAPDVKQQSAATSAPTSSSSSTSASASAAAATCELYRIEALSAAAQSALAALDTSTYALPPVPAHALTEALAPALWRWVPRVVSEHMEPGHDDSLPGNYPLLLRLRLLLASC